VIDKGAGATSLNLTYLLDTYFSSQWTYDEAITTRIKMLMMISHPTHSKERALNASVPLSSYIDWSRSHVGLHGGAAYSLGVRAPHIYDSGWLPVTKGLLGQPTSLEDTLGL